MTQDITQGDITPKRCELLEKLKTLQIRINELRDAKKALNKDYKEQIDDQETELKAVLDELETSKE